MTPNEVCAEIIRTVNASNLNFQVNQTPYSMYISIRKKFLKDCQEGNLYRENQSKDLKNENEYLREEYEKLYGLYKTTFQKNIHLESEVSKFEDQLEQNRRNEVYAREFEKENKALKNEKEKLKETSENLRKENKDLKSELDDLKKAKCSLNGELRNLKKELAEEMKKSEKNLKNLEKKCLELKEFKNEKLSEEREARMKQKKELKKEKKKNEIKVDLEKNKETVSEETGKTQDHEKYEPNVTTFNAFDTLNPLDIATSSVISYDNKTHDDNKIAEVDDDTKVQEIHNKEQTAFILEPDPTDDNPSTSHSSNTSTDQPKLSDEFKANVTEMIQRYNEDHDCNVS